VTDTLDDRLTRYAAFAAVHGVVAVAAAAGVVPWVVVLVATAPLLFAWGAFHADLATNGEIAESERNRWRMLLWLVPWSMTAYWLRYVRPRRDA
jgi:hypothetical protein